MDSLRRHLADSVLTSLTDSPVVFIQGARQTGKSTLARSLAAEVHPARDPARQAARYLTLDDSAVLSSALSDPDGFLAGIGGPVILDEVQRAPSLAIAIKAAVDRDRRPGRFLLTGSADFMVLPKLSESLAGRVEIHTLWPFSQGELLGRRDTFVDAVFAKKFAPPSAAGQPMPELTTRFMKGGYPEMLRRKDAARRRAWFDSYIAAILQRDVRDISNVRDLAEMPRLLALIAARAASLLDYADLSRALAMPQTTLRRYMALLEATFLVHTLPPWFVNIGKRLVKTPKLYLDDTGLLLHLAGADAARLRRDATLCGAVVENFVVMELLKQRGWSNVRPSLYHFRTHNGDEVDIVLEDAAGRVVGIEVKAAGGVTANHFKGLKVLAEAAGDRFVRGFVLNSGPVAVPFGKNLLAMPISGIWAGQGA